MRVSPTFLAAVAGCATGFAVGWIGASQTPPPETPGRTPPSATASAEPADAARIASLGTTDFRERFRQDFLTGVSPRTWEETRLVLAAAAKIDPDFALGLIEDKHLADPFREQAMLTVFEATGCYRRREAMAWYHDRLNKEPIWTKGMNKLLEGWMAHSYEEVHDYVRTDLARSSLLEQSTVRSLCTEYERQHGLESVEQWPDLFPTDSSLQYKAITVALEKLYDTDVIWAAEWFRNHAGRRYAADATNKLVADLARDDPSFGMVWATSLDNPAAQTGVGHAILTNWAQRSPAEAEAWVYARTAEGDMQHFLEPLARGIATKDISGAMSWAGRMADSVAGDALMLRIAEEAYTSRTMEVIKVMKSKVVPERVRAAFAARHPPS